MNTEPMYVLPDGTELYEQDLINCSKFHDKEIFTLTESEMVEWIETVRCHPYLEPIIIDSNDDSPMSYEEWFLANEDQLLIHCAESGLDREPYFDIEKQLEKDYQTYLNKGARNG